MNYPIPHFTTLADKALLVKLSQSRYQPYAHDAAATSIIEQTTGVVGAGRYNKRLFAGNKQLTDVNTKFNVLYSEYLKRTVPWLDDGVRMTPNELYFEFAQDMREYIRDALQAADQLVNNWDNMVAVDIARLGSLGNPDDYPTKEDIRAKFDARIQFFPVPTANDFRISVSDEDKMEMEDAIKQVEANISKHLLKEMLDPISSYVSKLSIPIGEKGAVFRDSLVENVNELVNRLPKLNINNDPEITRIINDVKAVVETYSMTGLRESPIMRENAREKMARIQKDLSAFMGG